MDSLNTGSNGVILNPLNYTQYIQSIKNQFADTNAEYLHVLDGEVYVMPVAPSLNDKILDLSTGKPTNRDMFPSTDVGNKAYMEACNTYKKELKELQMIFGKIMKVTLMSISESSECIMKAYGDFEKAKENVATFWKLLKESHQSTSDREINNQLYRFINCKQGDSNFLTHLANFNKVSLEVQDAIPNFINLSSTELMDIFKKVLLMNGIDKEFFKQVIDNELDSNNASSYTELQKRLAQFFRNSTDSSLASFDAAGYAAFGSVKVIPVIPKKVDLRSECYDCNEEFTYAINAKSGLPFQRCLKCSQKRNTIRTHTNKNEKPTKNLSLTELHALMEAQKKAAAADVETKLAASKSSSKTAPAIKKKTAALPAKKGTTMTPLVENDNEFGVESDDSY